MSKTPGFNDAKNILEVGAGAFETSVYLAKLYPQKHFYGVDFVLSDKALTVLRSSPPNLTVIKHDARDLRILGEKYFDLIFSVAVMEHIRELEVHLKETYRILREGGHYCFWEAPFWSCSVGHHFKNFVDKCPIPPYGHLYMTRDELKCHLISNGADYPVAEQILSRVHDREDLSRLTRTETLEIIEKSSYEVEFWEEDFDSNHTKRLANRVLKNNLFNVPADDLKIKGARVHLRRLSNIN